jgi:hypothetical protein
VGRKRALEGRLDVVIKSVDGIVFLLSFGVLVLVEVEIGLGEWPAIDAFVVVVAIDVVGPRGRTTEARGPASDAASTFDEPIVLEVNGRGPVEARGCRATPSNCWSHCLRSHRRLVRSNDEES